MFVIFLLMAIVILIVARYVNAEPRCGCFDQSDANS